MADLQITGNEITITGAGFSHTVTVAANETVADALDRNGIDASRLGVDLLVNGSRVDASDVRGSDVPSGSRLAAPPKNASLG
jgi:sulfur carrier protein ThiS